MRISALTGLTGFIESWAQIAEPAPQMRRTFTFLPFTFPADNFFTA
jgi:hypothetical protein